MKKKLLILLAVFMLVCAAVIFYVNTFILPSKIKTIIADKITELTGHQAVIQGVRFSLAKGFELEELTVFEKDLSLPPALQIKRLNFNVLYLAVLKEKKIIIPSLNVQGLRASLVRHPDGLWNFNDMAARRTGASASSSAFSFLIGRIKTDGAVVTFLDETVTPPFFETIQSLDATARFSLPTDVKFQLTGSVLSSPDSHFSLQGTYGLMTKKLSSRLHLQGFDIAKYFNPYHSFKGVSVHAGKIPAADITFNFQDKQLGLKVAVTTLGLSVSLPSGQLLSGNPLADISLSLAPGQGNPLRYKGSLNLNQSTLSGLPYISSAEHITGTVLFDTKEAKTDDLAFSAAGQHVSVSGVLQEFSSANTDIKMVSQNVSFEKLKEVFPEILKEKEFDADGTFDINLTVQGPLSSPENLDTKATATLNNVNLKAEVLPKPLSHINGKISYQKHKAVLHDLNAAFCDTPLVLSGTVTRFEDPLIDVRIQSEAFDLAKLGEMFPKYLRKANLKEISGQAALTAAYRGPLSAPAEGDLKASVVITGAGVGMADIPEKISGINGKVSVSLNSMAWQDLKMVFKNTAYTLNGKISDFKNPFIQTSLASPYLSVNTRVKWQKDNLTIDSCQGTYLNSSFRLQGNADLSDKDDPRVDLKGTADLDLTDLPVLSPRLAEKLKAAALSGICSLQGTVTGPAKNWRNLTVSLDAAVPKISAYGYQLTNARLKFAQENLEIGQCDLNAEAYDGTLAFSSTADLSQEDTPYVFNARGDKINLEKFREDSIWKKENIAGRLSFVLNAKGAFGNLDDINGQGSVLLTDGRIWQMNLLKGLGQFLFIPEFENIVFNEAKGDIFIKDRRLSTTDFQLISQPLTLDCSGWMGFDGNIDFDIVSEFSEETIAESSSLKKALTAILTQGEAYLMIKVNGTLKNPKYKLSSAGVLKKTTNLLLDSIKGILE